MDWSTEVQTLLGRINNLSALAALIYIFMLFPIPRMMRSGKERVLLISLSMLMLYAICISVERYTDFIITFGGLITLMGAISAGLGAYALGKSGKGIHTRIAVFTILTLPALGFAPALISLDTDAYAKFWLNVYGYSNVRVFGYFAAATTVILSGLVMASLNQKRLYLAIVHFLALAFSWSMLFWSGSRAGMIAVAISICVSWVIFWRKEIVQIPFVIASGAVGALLSMLYYIPDSAFGIVNRVQKTVSTIGNGDAAGLSSGRFDLWQWAWDRILEEPLLGRGYLPMSGMRTPEFNYYHTHNIILEYFLSFGLIVGSIALALALTIWVKALIAARRIDKPVAHALTMLVILLPIYAMFSATLFFPFHLMIFMTSMGALIGWDVFLRSPPQEEEIFRAEADWMFEDLE
jgi:O-antigen ligase